MVGLDRACGAGSAEAAVAQTGKGLGWMQESVQGLSGGEAVQGWVWGRGLAVGLGGRTCG